ncbi:ribosome maturation factor RimM [Alteromonas sp. 5E99-2]|uniref:ribosome maturation factor RimM n=1 Tax=Alteromonas sp. 5E99-2 TaxID=2817683 RepID=UPI001A99A1F1|nr:ribosome maturation factor RimM [Alteromonas sp. 5E99-2]MBO1256103.1 ribosome maturation factor RimM [Alteromonas sp. 5E99-2]
MSHASDNVVIGKIGAPHGVKGWVKIHSFTQQQDGVFSYQPWVVGERTVEVEQWRVQGNAFVAKLVDVDSREAVDALKNFEIEVAATLLPDLGEDEFYWRDLKGMRVVNLSGYDLGLVQEVFNTGANDVLQVKANPKDAFGQRERLIPFVFDQVINKVDTEEKVITVDWDPGF